MAKTIETSIDVHVPASTAYEQWTRLEEIPRFLRHVDSIRASEDGTLRWRARIGGCMVEWDARIVECVPGRRVVWRCTSGAGHAGVATFRSLTEDKCRVGLRLEYDSAAFGDDGHAPAGVSQAEIEDDLRSFANALEARQASSAWRREER